jgi:hypothetical protein
MESKEKKLETIISINIVGILLFFLVKKKYFLDISLIVTIICLLSPAILNLVHKAWSTFFSFLGVVNSKILLSVVFFIFLTPIAFVRRIFSKRKTTSQLKDNFITRQHQYTPEDLKKMG